MFNINDCIKKASGDSARRRIVRGLLLALKDNQLLPSDFRAGVPPGANVEECAKYIISAMSEDGVCKISSISNIFNAIKPTSEFLETPQYQELNKLRLLVNSYD